MKKHSYTLGLGLTVAMLTACTTIDEDVNPSASEATLPMLAMSVGGGTTTTRMSDDVVQRDGTYAQFRGISDLYVIPFRKPGNVDSPVTSTDTPIGPILFGSGSNAIGSTAIDEQNHSKYYKDVSLPVGTSAFLVYGKATDKTAPAGTDANALNGTLQANALNGTLQANGLGQSMVSTSPGSISFNPVKIYADEDNPSNAEAVANWLTEIYGAADGDWAEIGILNSAKDKFLTMHAGSARSVRAFVYDLYNSIKQGVGIAAVDAVISKIQEHLNVTTGEYISGKDFSMYPADKSLPDGAAVITWNESNKCFNLVMDNTNVGAINVTGLGTYVYPPALWYYTNSHIHVSEVKYETDANLTTIFNSPDSWDGVSPTTSEESRSVLGQLYNGTAFYQNNGSRLFTANGRVESTTTLVAITKPLQYGVGRLEMTVKAGSATLKDATSPTAKSITIGTDKFPITGLLIERQYATDYQFHPTTPASTDDHGAVMYDSQFAANTYYMMNGTPAACTTLSLETPENTKVIICVELQNNSGEAFTGVSNQIIPNGGRFYLLGELDPTKADTFTQPTGEILTRVFEQDRVTKVNFTVNTLANAYNVIPDFTNPTIKFSLGVTDWKVSTPTGTELQ